VFEGLVEFAMLGASNPVGLVLFSLGYVCYISVIVVANSYICSYGFLFGSVIALYLPMITNITLPGTDMGKRMGFALAPVGVATLIGPPITGAILGKDYAWWKAIVFSSVS
jgi:hypothetical protein